MSDTSNYNATLTQQNFEDERIRNRRFIELEEQYFSRIKRLEVELEKIEMNSHLHHSKN